MAPILLVMTLRPKVKELIQGHTASKWQDQDSTQVVWLRVYALKHYLTPPWQGGYSLVLQTWHLTFLICNMEIIRGLL